MRNHVPDEAFTCELQFGLFTEGICMYVGFCPIHDSQCMALMVFHLDASHPTVFFTGPVSADAYDPLTLFWQHERLHRATLQNYHERFATYHADRDVLEAEFVEGGLKLACASAAKHSEYAAECYARALAAEAEWLKRVQQIPAHPGQSWLYELAWRGFNKDAKMPEIV